jgi:hypothetical protein
MAAQNLISRLSSCVLAATVLLASQGTLIASAAGTRATAAITGSPKSRFSAGYTQAIYDKIYANWDKVRPTMDPIIIVGFQVEPDGDITDVRVKRSNANARSNKTAVETVTSAGPIEQAGFFRAKDVLYMDVVLGLPQGYVAETKRLTAAADKLWRDGKVAEAEKAKLQLIERSKKAYGKDFPETAEQLRELASFYESNDKGPQAADALRQAVKIYETCYAQSPRDYCVLLSYTLTKLAKMLEAQNSSEAEAHFKRAVEVDKTLPNKNWSGYYEDAINLAEYQNRQHRDADAEKSFIYAASLVDKQSHKTDPATLEGYAAVEKLANYYAGKKKYADAEKQYEALLEVYTDLPKPAGGADDFEWFDGYKKMLSEQKRSEDLQKLNKRLEPILISGSRKVDPSKAYGYLNDKGEYVIQPKFWNAADFSDGLASVCLHPGSRNSFDQKYAFIDHHGKIAFNRTFYAAHQFHAGHAQVALTSTSLPQVIDTKGDLLPDQYRNLQPFCDGLAAVELIDAAKMTGRGYLMGYLNTNLEMAIPAKFDVAGDFRDARAIVGITVGKIDRKYGVIDKAGKYLIQPKYSDLREISPDKYAFRDNREYGIVDTSGEELARMKLADMGSFHEGMARIAVPKSADDRRGNWLKGFMDDAGKIVVKPIYDDVSDFSEGLAAVKKNDEWGYIDKTGAIVIDRQFSGAYAFSEGLAAVNTSVTKNPMFEGTFGFIDKTGKLIIPAIIYGAQRFHEGLAAVRFRVTANTYGYIDKTGQVIVGPTLAHCEDFHDGKGKVTVGDGANRKYGYVDSTGKYIIKPEYSMLGNFHEGVCYASRGPEPKAK